MIGELEFMDLLYHRYASSFEFMRPYIEQGRFGEFVNEIVTAENQRRKEQAEKEDEEKLWMAYVHVRPQEPYSTWKAGLTSSSGTNNRRGKRDEDMTSADIDALLSRLFPQNE